MMSVLRQLGVVAQISSRLQRLAIRSYGSAAAAAAAQLDYDFQYRCQDDENPQRKMKLRVLEESEGGETVVRGVQWVIMGDPMVRRHVYAERLAKLLDVPYISMGSLVRQELNPTSPLYKKIASAVNQGKLVPEDVIFALLSKRLEEGYCRGETGFILDGIPRTTMQAEILDQVSEIDLVLNLKCAEESVVKQASGKGFFSHPPNFDSMSTSGFNLSLKLGEVPFESSNADVNAIWKEKLSMYAEQRNPLEEYYRLRRKIFDFQVAGGSVDAWQGLLAALKLTHMSSVTPAPSSSNKLTLAQTNM